MKPALRSAINPFGTVEEFPAVDARYVRMTILKTAGSDDPCIDEFQIFSSDALSRNVALAAGGARASGSESVRPEFRSEYVNDGRGDGLLSWIANTTTNAWIQIELPKVERINRIVWSRDGSGRFSDRVPIDYRIEVATEPPAWRLVASSSNHLPLPDLIEIPSQDPVRRPKEYLVQKGGEEEDFPYGRVTDITQTPEGYLWIATGQGLVRFEGSQFRRFGGENTPAIGTSGVRSLRVDRQGRLLISVGVDSEMPDNLVIYEHGRFTRPDLQGLSLFWVFEDHDGVLWGRSKEGLFPWKNGRFDRAAGLIEFQESRAIQVGVGADSTVWLSKAGGAGRLIQGQFVPLLGSDGRELVLGTKDLAPLIVPRPKNGAWILEGGISLEIYRGPNRWRHLSADGTLTESKPFPWPGTEFEFRSAALDRAGNLWICAPGIGLFKLTPDGQRYELYTREEGLKDNDVQGVFEDRQGNIWVGGFRGGLNRLRKPAFESIDSTAGMRKDNVYSLSPARDGGVWIGTHSSGAYLWRQDRLLIHRKTKPHSWSVLEDSSGAFWNGTYGWGLWRFSADNEKIIHTAEAGDHVYTLALFEDHAGRVWLGGQHGLSSYDSQTAAVKSYVPPLFDKHYPDWVISLAEDSEGAIWLGTRTGFLHRLLNDEFKTPWHRREGPSFPVCSLYFHRPGELWFARFGFGLTRLKDGHFTHYTPAEGLPASTMNGILDDGRGWLWMTSKQGVYRISKTEFEAFAEQKTGTARWQRFTQKDGLPSDECHGEQNKPSLCQSADGRIWIPTVRGIGVIDPATLSEQDSPASAVIEQVLLFSKGNQALTLLADGESDASQPANLTVPPGKNNLVIRYTGIDLANPRKVNFKYPVAGVDHDWVDAKGARTAIYAALAPGS